LTDNNIERRETVDNKGQLVAVEIFIDGKVCASWSADFDRVLSQHPAVIAEMVKFNLS
jgi:hypothetical protein